VLPPCAAPDRRDVSERLEIGPVAGGYADLAGFIVRGMNLFEFPQLRMGLSVWKDPRMSSEISIDQARMAFLALSLAQIATQQQELSRGISTIRGMRHELAKKGSARVLQMAVNPRSTDRRLSRLSITGTVNLTRRRPGGSFLLPCLRPAPRIAVRRSIGRVPFLNTRWTVQPCPSASNSTTPQ
jgi:hypothetical protein